MALSYIASNIDIGYMANLLGCESDHELETFLTGLGNIIYIYV